MTTPDVVATATSLTQKEAQRENGKVLRRLKPGPGLSREAVALDQKLRLRVAFAGLAAESGYDAVTVRALIGRASISTSTFYKLYAGVEDCFAEVIRTTIRNLAGEIRDSSPPESDLRVGLRVGLGYLMESLAREPETARAVLVEASAAGRRVHDEMEAALGEFESFLTDLLAGAPRPAVGTTHMAVGLVAGVVRVVRKTTLLGRVEELPELAPELADWMLAVAHEKVVAFRAPRPGSRSKGAAASKIDATQSSREAAADGGRRATMAAARLAANAGLSGLTSSRIRKDAGLTRREFDRHFHGVEECFIDAIQTVASMAADEAEATTGDGGFEQHVYREITALCSLAASQQALARMVLIEITSPGRTGLLCREELIERCVAHLLARAPSDRRPSELVLDASVAAIWRIAEIEVAAGRAAQLPLIAPAFVYMILATRPSAGPLPVAASVRSDGAARQQSRL